MLETLHSLKCQCNCTRNIDTYTRSQLKSKYSRSVIDIFQKKKSPVMSFESLIYEKNLCTKISIL